MTTTSETVTGPTMPADVAAAFAEIPSAPRQRLLDARARIFALADETGAGPLTETLKWGQPAYLTKVTGWGSTLRLGLCRAADDAPALFVICQTSLADEARARFGSVLRVIGNRAVLIPDGPSPEFDAVIVAALTYKRRD